MEEAETQAGRMCAFLGVEKADCEDGEGTQPQVADQQSQLATHLKCVVQQKDEEILRLTNDLERIKRQLEKANNYNEDLRQELSKLSSKIHQHRTSVSNSAFTQVCEADFEEVYGAKPMPDWNGDANKGDELSIAESLKATVEDELLKQQDSEKCDTSTEYIYDASSGFYYHPTTGYYWDPNSGLFYDYTSGSYFQYNEQTGGYEVHSKIEVTSQPNLYSEMTTEANEVKKVKLKHKLDKTKRKVQEKNTKKRKLKRRYKNSKSSEIKRLQNLEKAETEVILIDDEDDNEDGNKSLSTNMKHAAQELSAVDQNENQRTDLTGNDDDVASDCESESSGSLATGESELVSELESGELSISDSSDSEEEMAEMTAQTMYTAGPVASNMLSSNEMTENYPPCIRVIVQESDHLEMGSLFIITCAGGTIGREKGKGHAIEINDINVSKVHAEIQFDYEKSSYILTDTGSQNGTVLNGNRLSKSKSESNTRPLQHSDILQIGSTKLLLHIHKGHETCEDCEPGEVQAKLRAMNPIKNNYVLQTKEEKNWQRRKELKNIKKKYGLQNSHFENTGAVVTDPNYCDKAHLRRKFIGSEADIPRHSEAPASVQRPISTSNKGHKLLAKMGWKEGEGLGKTSSGICEPINVGMRVNQSAGLGSAAGVSLSLDNVQDAGKAKRWSQARQRFQKLEESAGNKLTGEENTFITTPPRQNTTGKLKLLSKPEQSTGGYSENPTARTDMLDLTAHFGDSTLSNRDPYDLYGDTLPALSHVSSPPVPGNLEPKNSLQTSQSKIVWVKGGSEQISQSVPGVTKSEQSSSSTSDGKSSA